MPYIGNNPTDVPLTSSQIADGTIQQVDLAAGVGNDDAKDASQDSNIALLGFLRSTDHATSVLNMQNGYIDQFEDQTGIDDDECVGESYSATLDLYDNLTGATVEYTGMTAGMITNGTGLQGFVAANLVDDDTTTTHGFYTDSAGVGSILHVDFGVGNERELIEWEFYVSGTVTAIWTIEYSDDDSGWTAAATGLDMSGLTAGQQNKATWTSVGAHRYWRAYKTNGATAGSWHSEFRVYEPSAADMTLIAEPQTALAAPDSAHVALFNQEVDTLTINTDILAWVSRSKQTITATNATNVLNATTHLLVDTDRVMLISTAADLPLGLDSETVYYVVTATANTFQVSLTSGGAAVTFSDDGTGTHSVLAVTQCTLVDQGDFDTGKATLSGTVDISGQPSGTTMTLIVQTKNNKATKLHGQALQYA